jgi:hypothetical protein
MDLKDFLDKTFEYTLPHLILNCNDNFISEVASIVKMDAPILCVEQLHSILCAIFLSDADISKTIQKLVALVKSDVDDKEITFTTLLKTCALKLVAKLAVELGDSNETRRNKVRS